LSHAEANGETVSYLHEQLGEPLAAVLNCARRIAELSVALVHGDEHFWYELRRLHRDLPHLIAKAMTALRDYEQFAPDLKHELECVQQDAFEMSTWAKNSADELQKLFAASSAVAEASLQYGETLEKTMRQAETFRRAVLESCNRADSFANT